MAELPEIEFEAGKVEGETDDAFPEMAYPASAWIEYQATNDPKAIVRSIPAIIGAPILSHPTTTEGKRAHGCLERLRTAVKWGRLQPIDGQALCWTGEMWKKIPIDEIPKDVCPIRFSIDKQELKRWMKSERMASTLDGEYEPLETGLHKTNKDSSYKRRTNGFYIAAIRLIRKQEALKATDLANEMQKHGYKPPEYKTLQPAVKAAIGSDSPDYSGIHPNAMVTAKNLIAYACFVYGRAGKFSADPVTTFIQLLNEESLGAVPTTSECKWLTEDTPPPRG